MRQQKNVWDNVGSEQLHTAPCEGSSCGWPRSNTLKATVPPSWTSWSFCQPHPHHEYTRLGRTATLWANCFKTISLKLSTCQPSATHLPTRANWPVTNIKRAPCVMSYPLEWNRDSSQQMALANQPTRTIYIWSRNAQRVPFNLLDRVVADPLHLATTTPVVTLPIYSSFTQDTTNPASRKGR